MLTGQDEVDAGAHAHDQTPALSPLVTEQNCPAVYEAVRAAGTWLKVMGGTGCYLWVHTLTHETVRQRPEDYEEENPVAAAAEEVDLSCGLYSCKVNPTIAQPTPVTAITYPFLSRCS